MPQGDWTDVTFGMWGVDFNDPAKNKGEPARPRPTESEIVRGEIGEAFGCLAALLLWPFAVAAILVLVPLMFFGLFLAGVHDAYERRRADD